MMQITINDTINKRKQKKSKFADNKLTQEKKGFYSLIYKIYISHFQSQSIIFVITIITYNVVEKIY